MMIKAKAAWRTGSARVAGLCAAGRYAMTLLTVGGAMALSPAAFAQETVCAKVKIEIKQELAFERQGFEAEMKISNSTDTSLLENISVDVKVTDELGTPVSISTDPNDLSAKFFIRLAKKENIAAVDGTGTVAPRSTARIEWLLIPSPGAAGSSPLGKKYLVGATLRYRYNGEDTELNVSPGVIKVKPVPLLTLDYFLPAEVEADDPLTPEIEPVVPFTLGVRVRNNGLATASNLKIDSAQPKIIENKQGLLIGFKLTGSYINDAPAQNTLMANFGDIAGNSAKMGRWIMETTLSGKFTEFTARFSHADELGGALTSLVQATNAHVLVRDVKVDLPGRDAVRDFFARDGDILRIYESDGPDTEVTDQSALATLAPSGAANGFTLNFPVTAGFAYVKLKDPFDGQKPIGTVQRSDAKVLPAENVWLSRTRNSTTKLWEYWVNFFDVNSTGSYTTGFKAPDVQPLPPVLQYIPDRTVKEGEQVSFLVEASSPNGRAVQLSAAPLPTGARLLAQAATPQQPNIGRAVFDWTPPTGSVGSYTITYTANDGLLSASRAAKVTVLQGGQTRLPGTPRVVAPLSGAQVTQAVPRMAAADLFTLALSAATSGLTDDTATALVFELYADEGLTQMLATGSAAVPAGSTAPQAWQVAVSALKPNSKYWWRVRASDGQIHSPWVEGWFFANIGISTPGSFNQTLPSHGWQVDSLTPTLSWTNAVDADEHSLSYVVELCRDATPANSAPASRDTCNGTTNQVLVGRSSSIAPNDAGITSWTVQPALAEGTNYYWRVTAADQIGARTGTSQRMFTVNTANSAPTAPVITGPGAFVAAGSATLSVQNSSDAQGNPIAYVFEVDDVKTFDSPTRRRSAPQAATSWTATGLIEDRRYWWRAKAQDGTAESAWTVGSFSVAQANQAPAVPTVRYPGQDAWVNSVHPSLVVGQAKDPEGQAVRYEFEIYYDAALGQKLAEGSSASPYWVTSKALDNLSTYWWRARAVDAQEAASDWTPVHAMHVRTGSTQGQSVGLTSPDRLSSPAKTQSTPQRSLVTLRWQVSDPGSDPKVALYYKQAPMPLPAGVDMRASFNGNLIVEGLKPLAGQTSGSYEWDVTALGAGAYYVYAVVYSNSGQGQSFAPGAVVVPAAGPTGTVTTLVPATVYEGSTATLGATLSGSVGAPVMGIPAISGDNSLQKLVVSWPAGTSGAKLFTTITSRFCYRDLPGASFAFVLASEDPNWHGRVTNVAVGGVTYSASNTGNEELRLCKIQVLSETPVNDTESDYVLTGDLANIGAAFQGAVVRATDGAAPGPAGCPNFAATAVQGELRYGAIGTREVGHTASTVVVRAPKNSGGSLLRCGPKWAVTLTG